MRLPISWPPDAEEMAIGVEELIFELRKAIGAAEEN
jgi:hypothetical protein